MNAQERGEQGKSSASLLQQARRHNSNVDFNAVKRGPFASHREILTITRVPVTVNRVDRETFELNCCVLTKNKHIVS